MVEYNRYPAMDADNNFPPAVRQSLAHSPEHVQVIEERIPPLVTHILSEDKTVADAAAEAADVAIDEKVVGLSLVTNAHNLASVSDAVGGPLDKNHKELWTTYDATGGPTKYGVKRLRAALELDVEKPEPTPVVVTGTASNRHAILENELRMANGGTIRTNGAAPVCIIFDHGLNIFRDTILPLLVARGLPSVMAINGNLHKPGYNIEWESKDVTWAEMNAWSTVEIANHGAAHSNNEYTLESLEAEIIGSLNELKANLPAKKILSWVQPDAKYPEDFKNGLNTASYADTTAGRMIYDNHAVATGMWRAAEHPLIPRDGNILQGVTGVWTDTVGTGDDAIRLVGNAAKANKGILLRNHPRNVGVEGKITIAEFTALLDFLKVEQDAGRIKVMNLAQWSIADTGK